MASVKALIFGSIGTVTETSELQREAFNAAFLEHGLGWNWSPSEYRAMISGERISVGGTNRIVEYADLKGVSMSVSEAAAVHATKTQLFQSEITRRKLPLNAGVDNLLAEARANGITTVFASTTARASIDAMLAGTEPALTERFDLVISGDDVAHAKPDPEIYLKVLDQLSLDASEAIAIEDSQPSLDAARGAGIATYVVPGLLWRGTAFEGAARVFDTLQGIDLTILTEPLLEASHPK